MYSRDEEITMYCDAYKEAFDKSTKVSFVGRKKEAFDYANSMFPELGKALKVMHSYMEGQKLTGTDEELLEVAYRISGILRGMRLKSNFFKSKNTSKNTPQPKNGTRPYKGEDSFMGVYRNWVASHNFVGSDLLLSHFCNNSPTTIGGIRYKLRKEGYEFNQVENGWEVTKRPVKSEVTAVDIISKMSKDELVELLVKKLKGM